MKHEVFLCLGAFEQ